MGLTPKVIWALVGLFVLGLVAAVVAVQVNDSNQRRACFEACAPHGVSGCYAHAAVCDLNTTSVLLGGRND